jgi:hypothetical protein
MGVIVIGTRLARQDFRLGHLSLPSHTLPKSRFEKQELAGDARQTKDTPKVDNSATVIYQGSKKDKAQ